MLSYKGEAAAFGGSWMFFSSCVDCCFFEKKLIFCKGDVIFYDWKLSLPWLEVSWPAGLVEIALGWSCVKARLP